jgi:hypothetical protein
MYSQRLIFLYIAFRDNKNLSEGKQLMDLNYLSSQYGDAYSAEFAKVIQEQHPNATRFLEWGSGATTKIICDVAKTRDNPFVLTIDDNADYQQKVASMLPLYPFLHFRSLNLQGPSFSQRDTEPSYSSYPFLMGLKFDFIFIDGRRRLECALTATQVAAPGAIVIVHDWRRNRYRPMRALFDTIQEGEEFLILRPKLNYEPVAAIKAERRAIVVPANGQRAQKELELTLPHTRAYAASVGADCHVVGEKSKLPAARLKSEALAIAQDYDRMLLLDADVLIRPGSPDIFDHVPAEKLGVFIEGRMIPRDEWCLTINEIYKPEQLLQSNEYFNSGVMVLSKQNYHLLESLKKDTIYGHPQFEQGLLNVKRLELNIPLFPLLSDFNYLPFVPFQVADWRFSYFYHLAGVGKSKYLYSDIWEDKIGDRRTFSRRPFISAEIRYGLILQASEQMNNNKVLIFDPTDFYYTDYRAIPLATATDGTVTYFPPMENGPDLSLCMYGPYTPLDKGLWKAKFLRNDGSAFIYNGAFLEIVHSGGETALLKTHWTEDGTFEFSSPEDVTDLELRVYRTKASEEFSMLRLEQISAI